MSEIEKMQLSDRILDAYLKIDLNPSLSYDFGDDNLEYRCEMLEKWANEGIEPSLEDLHNYFGLEGVFIEETK